jgi:hypothetical protein
MTRSVYIIGGAGTGKSTFTGQLLADREFGPVEIIADFPMGETRRPNPMHGQRLDGDGLYLGINRKHFPGSDGLSRTCGTTGTLWLEAGDLPRYIVSEGNTLATRRFMAALYERTELLLIHLTADPEVVQARLAQRRSNQAPSWVRGTATGAARLAEEMADLGARVIRLNSADEWEWELGLDLARNYLP